MATLVSVIIPTHNRAALVREAIESALNQTYPAREVIVVDDGSTDETPEVLARYGDAIRTVRTANRGCAAARNAGVGVARGQYLAFVDSDDAAPPDRLSLQVPVLDAHPDVGIVYGNSIAFGPDLPGEQVHHPVRPDPDGSVAEGIFFTTRIGFDSVLLRRAAVEQAGGFDESLRHNEDTDLLLRVALDWKAVCLDVPTGRHRWHAGRKSWDEVALRRAVLASTERVLAARPEFRERLGERAAIRLAEVRWEISRGLAARGDTVAARAEATLAWQLHRSAALAVWGTMLRIPQLVPAFLWTGRFLARSVGFARAHLPRR
ncbi:MAG: glycosyltransferase family 2 protein [candidate division NC10 bacterium]|nr:glycosyltransferase family 2 protein [candidate division NC10 bacterium]